MATGVRLESDFSYLQHYVHQTWASEISPSLQREHRRNAPPLDAHTTVQVCKKFSVEDRALLVRELSGGFLTQERKAKLNEDVSDSYPLSGQPDSIQHRILECLALQQIREEHADVVQWLFRKQMTFMCTCLLRFSFILSSFAD